MGREERDRGEERDRVDRSNPTMARTRIAYTARGSAHRKESDRADRITALRLSDGRLLKASSGYEFIRTRGGIALQRDDRTTVEFKCTCSGRGRARLEVDGNTATCGGSGGTRANCGWVIRVPGVGGAAGLTLEL
jgi:hypothetical protein